MNTIWADRFQSSDWNVALNFVLVLALLLPLMVLRPRRNITPRAQPVLLELAATRPKETVSVIVQKVMAGSSVEERIARLGGTVTRDLHIINAFAAELPARAVLELARADDVRWVSLDAPVTHAGNPDPQLFDL